MRGANTLRVAVDKQKPDAVLAAKLTPQERGFADEFFSGENAGNGTRSYLAVHREASYATASVAASELLKQPKIRAYLNDLHERATAATSHRLQEWTELLPMAQGIIVATARGTVRNRLAYEAAVQIVNRVVGTPVASHDVRIRDEAQIAKAVAGFARRMSRSRGVPR